MTDKKHKKRLKRKKIVARKNRGEEIKRRETNIVGYYKEIKKSIKNYKKDSSEYKKLNKIIVAYEKFRDAKKEASKQIKKLPVYRVVILTRRLDKITQQIKDCKPDNKKLKGLKEKKSILQKKLK